MEPPAEKEKGPVGRYWVNLCRMGQEKQDLRLRERDRGGREKGCLSREGGMGGRERQADAWGSSWGTLAGGFWFHSERGSEFTDREPNAGQV